MRVCCDRTDLTTAPRLWSDIQSKLAESNYLILLASPQSAQSPWVAREVGAWLDAHNGSSDHVLIVLTAGEIAWPEGGKDFDWTGTNALPRVLENRFTEEPRYEDLRSLTEERQLTLRNPEFQDVIASLAARISGRSKRELIGEELRQQRNRRLVLVTFAGAMAGLAAYAFYQERQATSAAERERQANENLQQTNTKLEQSIDAERLARRLAVQQGLAAQAEQTLSLQPSRLPESILTAIESIQTDPAASSLEAYQTLERGLNVLPEELRRVTLAHEPRTLSLDAKGARLTTVSGDSPFATGQRIDVFRADSLALIAGAVSRRPVNDARISPDGTQVAVGGAGTLEVLGIDASSKQLRPIRSEGIRPDVFVAVSPTGRYVASTGYGSMVRVYAYGPEQRSPVEYTHPGVRSLMFSNDERFVLAGGPTSIAVWPVSEGRGVTCRTSEAVRIAFGPGGRFGAAALVGGVTQVWRFELEATQGGGMREPCSTVGMVPHQGRLTSLAVSPDGLRVAASSLDGTARIWDTDLGREIARATHQGPVNDVAITPDGTRFVTAGADRTLRLWQTRSNRMEARHLAAVDNVRLTDDQQLVTTGANGVRRAWRLSDSQIVERSDRMISASLGVAEDGNRYVANTQSPDGRFATVLVSDGSLYVWDLSEPNSPDPLDIDPSDVTAIAVSNNGRVIATGDTVGRVRMYSLGAGSASERTVKLQASSRISALAFNASASRIAAGTSAGDLHIWSTDASSMRRIGLGGQVSSVLFERDGAGVVAATAGEVALVGADSDTVTSRLPAPGLLRALALSRDGQIVAAGDRTGVIRIWDRRSSRQIAEITQSGGVLSLAFSADGSRIAAGSENQLATIWQWRREDLIRDACARLGVNYRQTETHRRACPQSTSP